MAAKIRAVDATIWSFMDDKECGLKPGDLCWTTTYKATYDGYRDLESARFPEGTLVATIEGYLPHELTHQVVRCLGECSSKEFIWGRWIPQTRVLLELEPMTGREVRKKRERNILVGSTISQKGKLIVFDSEELELPYGVQANISAHNVTLDGNICLRSRCHMTYGEAFAQGRLYVVKCSAKLAANLVESHKLLGAIGFI
jgi:hypothetical protein